jgi:hypothetical protein
MIIKTRFKVFKKLNILNKKIKNLKIWNKHDDLEWEIWNILKENYYFLVRISIDN